MATSYINNTPVEYTASLPVQYEFRADSSSYSVSSSVSEYAETSSLVIYTKVLQITSSLAETALTASYVVTALTASYVVTALTASYVDTTPVNIGSISGTSSLNFAVGKYQSAVATGPLVLAPPTNGSHGARLEVWIKDSGTGTTLDFDPAIVRPSDSAASFPKTLTSNLTYIVLLRNSSNVWWLTSLVGGY